jgi:hypothetical protein
MLQRKFASISYLHVTIDCDNNALLLTPSVPEQEAKQNELFVI